MSTEAFKGFDVNEIRNYLHGLLDKQTSHEVLELDKELRKITNTQDQLAFMQKFEGDTPEKKPELLEEWSKYCLIRTQLSNHAHQRVVLNDIKRKKNQNTENLLNKLLSKENIIEIQEKNELKKESDNKLEEEKNNLEKARQYQPYQNLLKDLIKYQDERGLVKNEQEENIEKTYISNNNITIENDKKEEINANITIENNKNEETNKPYISPSSNPELQTIPVVSGIESVVKNARESGVPFEKFLETLGTLYLQTVSTEHPTDPLTNTFREALMNIAVEMEKSTPNEELLQNYIKILQQTDSIPPKKRNVNEEVGKTFGYLSRLYDSIPVFIKELSRVCQNYYGSEVFLQHEEIFWRCFLGGI